MNENPSNI